MAKKPSETRSSLRNLLSRAGVSAQKAGRVIASPDKYLERIKASGDYIVKGTGKIISNETAARLRKFAFPKIEAKVVKALRSLPEEASSKEVGAALSKSFEVLGVSKFRRRRITKKLAERPQHTGLAISGDKFEFTGLKAYSHGLLDANGNIVSGQVSGSDLLKVQKWKQAFEEGDAKALRENAGTITLEDGTVIKLEGNLNKAKSRYKNASRRERGRFNIKSPERRKRGRKSGPVITKTGERGTRSVKRKMKASGR